MRDVRACTVCNAFLPLGPRPIIQLAPPAKVLVIGQAPGRRVHETGVPWDDPSGARLRAWMGIGEATFYDPEQVALMPMGLCYPGVSQKGGDLPPRPECAPLWHDRFRQCLTSVRLTLLVGLHAQKGYLGSRSSETLTESVRNFERSLPGLLPLPHPSWRSTGWMRRNPWFEAEVAPALRSAVAAALGEQKRP